MRSPIRALAVLAALLSSCTSLPSGGTDQGRDINAVWVVFFWAGVGVAAIVYGLILWSMVRYRRRSDDTPPQFRDHLPLEALYTLLPIALVTVLFVLTWRAETNVEEPAGDPVATVRVEAFDWSWRFSYEGTGVAIFGTPDDPPEMVLPVGRPVRLVLTSADVIHAFYVPDFLFKRDAIPGRTTSFDLTVREPGEYRGQCAEFCGLDHYRMRFSIRAVPAAEFAAWLSEAAREAASA
jgi:cytochrome c oxidase subunit II